MSADGLCVEVEKGRGENKTKENIWISAPFEIVGACRDPHGREWGKFLRWHDQDGRTHNRHVADAALQGEPAQFARRLCRRIEDQSKRPTPPCRLSFRRERQAAGDDGFQDRLA